MRGAISDCLLSPGNSRTRSVNLRWLSSAVKTVKISSRSTSSAMKSQSAELFRKVRTNSYETSMMSPPISDTTIDNIALSNSAISVAEDIQQREMSVGTQATVTPDEVPEMLLPTRHPRVVVQLPQVPPIAEQSPSRKAPPAAATRNSTLKRKASTAKDNSRPSSSVSKRSKALRETETALPPPSPPNPPLSAEVSPIESDTICVSHPSLERAPSTPIPAHLDEEDSGSVIQEQSTDLLTQFGARPHRSGGAQAGELHSASKATSVAEENDIAFEAQGRGRSRKIAGPTSTKRAR